MNAPMILHVLPHTHWDREWYEQFEGYRMRLVKVVDTLLRVLDEHPTFHWHFDGQSAAIEDYLAVRPGRTQRVKELVAEGRLALGPWRILMDEFLCSGETIVHNLRQGMSTANELGAHPTIGYIPDSFGHIAQMPQILALAGMKHALVWRGVPGAVDRPLFRWSAPDGTTLPTMYLATSYSNAATLPTNYEDLMVRAKRILEDMAPFEPPGVVLGMSGSDHLGPQEHLPQLFAEANERQSDVRFEIGSLDSYIARVTTEASWPQWRGEMRSSARANLLMGVLSARMPLKQKEFAASTALERYAEPLCAISGFDPGTMLEECWKALVENSAHDSVCGCGIDPVARAVASRYDRASFIARAVAGEALRALGENAGEPASEIEGALFWNPSSFERSSIAEVVVQLPDDATGLSFVDAGGSAYPTQVLETSEQVIVDMSMRGADLARLIPAIHSRKMGTLFVNDLELAHAGASHTVELRLGAIEVGDFDIEDAKRTVEAAIAAEPRAKFRVFGKGPALARVLVATPPTSGLGTAVMFPSKTPAPVTSPLTSSAVSIGNEYLRVEASGDSATLWSLSNGMKFVGIGLRDTGDAGDEYTWSPPARDVAIEGPQSSQWSVDANGDLERHLRCSQLWRIPQSLDSSRRTRSRKRVDVPVTIDYSLRAGERFVRVAIEIDNRAKDHRLRLHVPVPFIVEGSDADSAFAVVHRGLTAESGPHETGTPSFPSRRWVDISDGNHGIAVLHTGTPEYEVDADGRGIAITLVRSVEWLSRQDCSTRTGPAGPMLHTPEAQLQGPHTFSLALYPHSGGWEASGVHQAAEEFACPFAAVPTRGTRAPEGFQISIQPAQVHLSILEMRAGNREVRMVNASNESTIARISFSRAHQPSTVHKIGIFGNEPETIRVSNGSAELPLRAWEIATLQLV